MNALLQNIRNHSPGSPIAENIDATLVVEVEGVLESFAVRVNTSPIIGIEAPSSLWELLEPYREAPRELASTVAQWVAGRTITYPVVLGARSEALSTEGQSVSLWPRETICKEMLAPLDLGWAAKHLSLERSNSLFPRPFEHQFLWEHREDLLPLASQIDLLTHRMSRARTIVAPKSTVGTRRASQLDPLDALLLTALVNACGPTVEEGRVPVGEGVVHSFRFQHQDWGGLWDPGIGFTSFETASDDHIQSGTAKFVVEADVSAFYDRIPANLVGARLERMGIHPRRAESATRLLSSVSRLGLPVGPSTSAFFAEAVLAAVDNMLLSHGVRYVRFNDDFRLFCRSEVQANEQLVLLTDALSTIGLSLQSEKTRISTATEYTEQRQSSREWWLRKLGKESSGLGYGGSVERSTSLLDSAMSVLLESIDGAHVAWLKLGREAFRAITNEQKATVVPHLLSEIPRLWPLSSDIAMTLRYSPEETGLMQLADAIPESFVTGVSKLGYQHTLEFALIWILDALHRRDWPGRNTLLPLLYSVPTGSPARRELVLALHGFADDTELLLPEESRWSLRCRARLGIAAMDVGIVKDDSPAGRFEAALTAAIAAG